VPFACVSVCQSRQSQPCRVTTARARRQSSVLGAFDIAPAKDSCLPLPGFGFTCSVRCITQAMFCIDNFHFTQPLNIASSSNKINVQAVCGGRHLNALSFNTCLSSNLTSKWYASVEVQAVLAWHRLNKSGTSMHYVLLPRLQVTSRVRLWSARVADRTNHSTPARVLRACPKQLR